MDRRFLLIISFFLLLSCRSERNISKSFSPNILLDGASFADERNKWFSYLCNDLYVKGFNKAIGGTSIHDTAIKLYENKLYSLEEMDDFGILLLMHVHNQDVCVESEFRSDYREYESIIDDLSYTQAYDYVISKYTADCYNLKYNKKSIWYKSLHGKPCIIVCMTHWHDARTIFNQSIRDLQKRHKFYLCEIDKNIGFSKDDKTLDGIQPSLLYSRDSEIINGIKYGWHMKFEDEDNDNERCYIQNKVASIIQDLVIRIHSEYMTERL